MANKLFLVSATLAFFFLLTNASIYRTVVELEEDDATNPMGPIGKELKCRREFQQAGHLRACQQWLHKKAMQARPGPWSLEDEFDFEDDMVMNSDQHRPPLLQQCCDELHQEEPDCVCPTLKLASKMVRFQIQQGQPQVVSRIYQTATHLPNICKIPQVSICPFRKAMPFQPPFY